jgi:hypothetical protein
MGSVVRTLHALPVLTRQMIRGTVANPAFNYLATSNLAEAIELVKFTPLSLSLEEISKRWSVFFQTAYTLSIAYQGTLVLIESEAIPRAVLPIRARNFYVMPYRQPVIEQLMSQTGVDQPILVDSTLVIRGQRLRGEVTLLRIGGIEVTPEPQNVTDTDISLPLNVQLTSPPVVSPPLSVGQRCSVPGLRARWAPDNTFRALRASPRAAVPTTRRRPAMAAVEGQKQRSIFDTHHSQTLPGDVVRSEGGRPVVIQRSMRPTMASALPTIFTGRRTIATRSTTRGCR